MPVSNEDIKAITVVLLNWIFLVSHGLGRFVVGSGGRKGMVVQSHLPPFRKLGNFIHPTFACVFWKRL